MLYNINLKKTLETYFSLLLIYAKNYSKQIAENEEIEVKYWRAEVKDR